MASNQSALFPTDINIGFNYSIMILNDQKHVRYVALRRILRLHVFLQIRTDCDRPAHPLSQHSLTQESVLVVIHQSSV